MKIKPTLLKMATSSLLLFVIGCSSDSNSSTSTSETESSTTTSVISNPVEINKFETEGISSVNEVECTLSNGQTSTCYQITIKGFPSDRYELGPYCPKTINTGAESAGKWFENGVLYDLTGEFITNLATFYGDSNWKLYDESTGSIKVTDTQTSCNAAARPNVAAEYQNYCVECDIAYFNSSGNSTEGIESTYLIPKTPVPSSSNNALSRQGVGIALNGVQLALSAPVEAILGAYTIAAFDDCIGHVNPYEGYHYHGANQGDGNCPAIPFEEDGHAGLIGYALDGYGIYGMVDKNGNESNDLDSCRGHSDTVHGYHYHTAGAGENAFIGCFKGEIAQ